MKISKFNKVIQSLKTQMVTYYCLVLVPSNSSKYFQIRIRKLIAHLLVIIIVAVSIYSTIMTVAHVSIKKEIKENNQQIYQYMTTNSQQEAYIKQLNAQLETINEKIAYLKSLEKQAKTLTTKQE